MRHSARGGHAARAQRHLLLPVLHAVQSRDRLDQPGGARLRLPPAHGPAGRGLRRRELLRALRARAAARRSWPTSARTSPACAAAARELVAELERTVGPAGEHPGNGRSIWLESPCLGLCERAPAVLVTRAGEDAREHEIAPASASRRGRGARRSETRRRPRRRSCRRRGTRRFASCAASARSIPASLDSYRARGRLRGARAAIEMGPTASSARSPSRSSSAAAAQPSRPDASGTPSPATPSGRTTWSATPTSRSRARSRTAS